MPIQDILQHFLASTGVSIDSRQVQKDRIFFALEGPNFDGHDFIDIALDKGAKIAIGHKALKLTSANYIRVEDSLLCLQSLARVYRSYLGIPIIAITGSNGKTTNKELLNHLLSAQYSTYCTEGNLNNHIGVPLSLLKVKKDCNLAIIEMGANHQGEISTLSEIAGPTHAYITNIGKAHLEGFGGIDGVRTGKKELYDFVLNNKGTFFLNDLEDSLKYLQANDDNIVTISSILNDHQLRYTINQTTPVHLKFDQNLVLKSNLFGEHQVKNIVCALAISLYFGIDLTTACTRIANFDITDNRFVRSTYCGNDVFLDAYNANPSSMRVSIDTFLKLKGVNKLVILGEMLELGLYAESEHEELLRHYLDSAPDLSIWCYGKNYKELNKLSPQVKLFKDFESLKSAFETLRNRQVLIKGSRGNKLERLLHPS